MASKVAGSLLKRIVINTPNAPAAIGPYSQAIAVGNTMYLSGQIGLVPATEVLISADVGDQTTQALKNLGAVLNAGGYEYSHVVRTTVMLADLNDYDKVNEIYSTFFTASPPARAAYQVARLPRDAKVEIEAIAILTQ